MTRAELMESTWEWLDKTLDWVANEPWWEYKRLDPRRRTMVTASDMGTVMGGDLLKIHRLWSDKLGLTQPEDLSQEWPVICGCVMEGPILHRYQTKAGAIVGRRQEFVIHPHHDWFACTLDGWDETLRCPVEAKWVSGREPLEVVIERYQPQLQSQMEITGAQQAALVVSAGGGEPVIEYIPRDAEYAALLIERGALFHQYIRTRVPPVDLPEVASPVVAFRSYDMTGNNLWADQAAAWLATKEAADTCADAAKTLKSLVPADGRKAYGHSVSITRDRAGRLSLRAAKEARK